VHADVAHQAFELPAELEQLANFVFLLFALGEERLHLARVLERDRLARLHRDQLGDLVAEVVAQIEHPAAVPDHRARGHRAERGDLRDARFAVLPAHVLDHPIAPVLAEVDVEVGQSTPARG
jgi:hypothetical protein